VACPAGTTATGGGTSLSGTTSDANGNGPRIITTAPTSTGFTGKAVAPTGFAGSWSLMVYAVCLGGSAPSF
jgi:hypothetical protein